MAKTKSIRKRNLGFKPITTTILLDEKIARHHIDKEHVIPVPKDLHDLYNYGPDVKRHRENLKPIIKQVYNIKL